MKNKLLITTLLITTSLFAKYDNCEFKNENYTDICKKVVKHGVSYKYANQFLLSYFKTQKFDEISWKYLQPSKIEYHKTKEKKANNVLVGYLPKMVAHLKKYKKVYDKVETKYGVNREIIAAILLKETKLGKIQPTHDAFLVFNTMVVRTQANTPREKWLLRMGKANMSSIIEYCYKKGVAPEQCNLPSSYAGAVGIPQFMPSSFVYAKAYRGKTPDLTNMEDAIVSVAYYLHKKAEFSKLIDWDRMEDVPKVEQEWYEYAFTHQDTSLVYEQNKQGKKYNCFTKDKPEFATMREYLKKIMRYNNSSNYAIGVMSLAYQAHYILEGER